MNTELNVQAIFANLQQQIGDQALTIAILKAELAKTQEALQAANDA